MAGAVHWYVYPAVYVGQIADSVTVVPAEALAGAETVHDGLTLLPVEFSANPAPDG